MVSGMASMSSQRCYQTVSGAISDTVLNWAAMGKGRESSALCGAQTASIAITLAKDAQTKIGKRLVG